MKILIACEFSGVVRDAFRRRGHDAWSCDLLPSAVVQNKQLEQKQAIEFFMELVNAPMEKIAVENPVSIMSSKYRKPDQIIQPWMFGHGETKATCLWLKNLPKLEPRGNND